MNEHTVQIFMSKYISDGGSYRRRVLLPVICAILSLILPALVLGIVIAANGGVKTVWMQWMIMLLLILAVAGSVILLLRASKNVYRDALVFCLVDGVTLYAVDAKPDIDTGAWRTSLKALYAVFKSAIDTANSLERIARGGLEEDIRTGKIETYASRIIQVNSLRRSFRGCIAQCSVITGRGIGRTQNYDISNHTEALFKTLESHHPFML